MKFLALVSGGKDSFFNIHHCLSQGHELVALANLYPELSDEIDSFMFQSVGHDVIPLYSECLDVPLYRRAITAGGSKNQKLEYSITKDDEIEDLYLLLKEIVEKHPDTRGVSCGAILSHYQRTRVENVCGRLGLTCLAYLWQRDQMELMGEMCQSGLDARLIKVAAIGLDTRHLGKSISEMYPILIKLNGQFEVHICGEGGEFETLVFDASFFQKRIEVVLQKVFTSSGDVSYVKYQVELKDKSPVEFIPLQRPALLDEEFQKIYEAQESYTIDPVTIDIDKPSFEMTSFTTITDNLLFVSNLTAEGSNIEEQAVGIFLKLYDLLKENGLGVNNVRHVNLILADMFEFPRMNAMYSTFFEAHYLPASRVCISTTLPANVLACLSCEVILGDNLDKEGIHIRSRSFWAPHNIGPYSQSILMRRSDFILASISGQIPLDPSSMELEYQHNPGFSACFALQHLHKVATLVDVPCLKSVVCYITSPELAILASKVWSLYVDLFDSGIDIASMMIVQVKQLPKGAFIEWGAFSVKEVIDMYADESESETKEYFSLKHPITFESSTYGRAHLFSTVENYLKLEDRKIEFTPVEKLWDYKGKEQLYGVVSVQH